MKGTVASLVRKNTYSNSFFDEYFLPPEVQ